MIEIVAAGYGMCLALIGMLIYREGFRIGWNAGKRRAKREG